MVERRLLSKSQPLVPAKSPEMLLSVGFLHARLQAPSERVRLWSAYQLASRWEGEWRRFVPTLWESQQEELRELAVNLSGNLQLKHYVFPLLQVFRNSKGSPSWMAAIALGHLGESTAKPLLWRWFAQLLEDERGDVHALECAIESVLLLDTPLYAPKMLRYLPRWQRNHTQYSTVFRVLCAHASTPEHWQSLAQSYGAVRTFFHDTELARILFAPFVHSQVMQHVKSCMSTGLSVSDLYREALGMLGQTKMLRRIEPILSTLPKNLEGREAMCILVKQVLCLLDALVPVNNLCDEAKALLTACTAWLDTWEEGILKVRNYESVLLVSLPISVFVDWLEKTAFQAEQVDFQMLSHLYHAPFSSPQFVCKLLNQTVLNTLDDNPNTYIDGNRESGPNPTVGAAQNDKNAPALPVDTGDAAGSACLPPAESTNPFVAKTIQKTDEKAALPPPQKAQSPVPILNENEKATLWRLYTKQLGTDENIAQQLPQPWDIPLASLPRRLGGLLRQKLPHDLSAGRTQEVEYALEMLRREGHPDSICLCLNWFSVLLNQCYDTFLDFMTHLPDMRFLPLLQAYYRRGESDALELMRFISDVHGLPHPTLDAPNNTNLRKLRLTCSTCRAPYHYAYHSLYINADCVEQRQRLLPKDVWTSQKFWCKRCGVQTPFAPEEGFLDAVFNELLQLRFSPTQESALMSKRLHPIGFPRFEGKVCNPANFLPIAEQWLHSAPQYMTAQSTWKTTRNEVLLELGKLRIAFKEPSLASQALKQIRENSSQWPYAQLHLGILAFQQGHMPQARACFVNITTRYSPGQFAEEIENPAEMAKDYLEMLDKQTYKRSHLRVLPSAT